MSLIDTLQQRLTRHPKRIVFPEGHDPRILQAARQFATRRLGVPILLGDRADIKDRAHRLDIRLDGMRVLDPQRSEEIEGFVDYLSRHPRFAEEPESRRAELACDRNHFAALMVCHAQAEALVGGATVSASNTLRPLFRLFGTQPQVRTASSLLILDQEDSRLGIDGVLFLADCGVIPEPSASQLADIAVTTADLASHLTGALPRVALLSFATHTTRPHIHPSIGRIREAVDLIRARASERSLDLEIEGEVQVDAALNPDAAAHKGLAHSQVAGRANVLIFPDLNSANIASKLVQQVAGTRSYGQIITGLRHPCAEISRGAHAIDIFGASTIVGCQAIDRDLLYGRLPGNP